MKHYPGDITEEDIKQHLDPHLNKFIVYVKEFIIPEMCDFSILFLCPKNSKFCP